MSVAIEGNCHKGRGNDRYDCLMHRIIRKSREQEFITKKCIATHTNSIVKFKFGFILLMKLLTVVESCFKPKLLQ